MTLRLKPAWLRWMLSRVAAAIHRLDWEASAMAVQFGSGILDTMYAPGISSFNEAVVPDLGNELTESGHWLHNLFLNSIFGPTYSPRWKQAAITMLFRTHVALRSYQAGREATLACAKKFEPGRPATNSYLEAVSHWETVLLNLQIVLDLWFGFMDPRADKHDDQAVRIRLAANRIKHFAEDIAGGKNSSDLTLPMWLTRTGVKTRTTEVSFEELAEHLRDLAKAAVVLQNPGYVPPSP